MEKYIFIVKETFFILSRKVFIISGKLSCESDTIETGYFVEIDEYIRQIDAVEVANSNDEGYIALVFNFQEVQDGYFLRSLKNNDLITILSNTK